MFKVVVKSDKPYSKVNPEELGPLMKELVGVGKGFTEGLDGYRDFGECGFCGMGHYIGPPGSLWGQCDNCGAS